MYIMYVILWCCILCFENTESCNIENCYAAKTTLHNVYDNNFFFLFYCENESKILNNSKIQKKTAFCSICGKLMCVPNLLYTS